MRVAVVSAIFGNYDEPVFVEQSVPCDYVMVTDGLGSLHAGWDYQVVDIGGLDPRLAGKFVKCRPWEYVDADIYVWLDGSIVPDPGLVEFLVGQLGSGDVGFFGHYDRSRLTSEAELSARLKKYSGQDVLGQVDSYLDAGHPDGWGLWTAGVFVWRDGPVVRQLGQMWLDEICRWTVQDQLSLPVVLRRLNLNPVLLDGCISSHRLLRIRAHSDRT